jgi:hypothetical protein
MPRERQTHRGKEPTFSPVKLARKVPENVRLRLVAASAGRCEFRGCNKDLYVHSVTNEPGNFAEAAHIVAFRSDGPRGSEIRPHDINAFDNLMLLCAECHHLIDTNPERHPVEQLRGHKREHEERIFALTALGPEHRTTVIQLRASIGGQPVDIPASHIRETLLPRYPARLPGVLIDLTPIQRENERFFEIARDQVRRELRPALRAELETKLVRHYSVFALAPIPILACFGREFGDKVSTDLYQRHRDTQSWKWEAEGTPVEYDFFLRKSGGRDPIVGLILSLSGKVTDSSLPSDALDLPWLYEITLKDQEPNREFLRLREDLARFRGAYQEALGTILKTHDGLKELHLFPAVPAPVAVACGQELLPKVHPSIVVYDNVRGTFRRAITINTPEDL